VGVMEVERLPNATPVTMITNASRSALVLPIAQRVPMVAVRVINAHLGGHLESSAGRLSTEVDHRLS